MKNLNLQFAVLLLSALCLLTGAYAQLTPSGDAYTNTAMPTTNFGSKTLLDVQSASQTTYIQFDLSSIPAGYTGAEVAKATLKLYVNGVTTAGSFNVDYVNGAWSEGTITANNAPALGTTIAASVPLNTAEKNQYILIDITAAVQAWLNGSQPNDGVALVGGNSLNATFDSKENTTTSHPAELDIVFAAGGGITGITTANGSGLMGGGNSGTLNLSLTNTCAANQVLQWNGTSWICAAVGTGTITGVTAGTDLTGGGSSGTVTVNVDTTKVPQLAAANTFTGNQTVNGNLSATGAVTGNSYQIGSNLFAFGSTSVGNAFLGFAGNTTMSGDFNTATGYTALQANTSGNGNTATGYTALLDNTSGIENTAIGFDALISNNSGFYNVAVGSSALFSNSTGAANTAIGAYSGQTADSSNLTGNSNTALGYRAAFGTGTLSNATAIGANAEVTAGNALVLGSINGVNGATASTNVGIGTTAPISTLDVDAYAKGALGPVITLTNPGGGTGATTALFFNSYAPRTGSSYNPAAAIFAEDFGGFSDAIVFAANKPGTFNNGLQSTMSIDPHGNVAILGNLTKGSGSFKIDHPLDPANKYLYHSFVESPDMMNIYNGVATLDARGSVWITLPDYFEALNQDFRYQLTSIGRPQPSLYVAREISGNRFRISGGKPDGKVSWQVTGVRHDAYADAHRIQVEEKKPAAEQGHYLHPELFGAGPEQAVGYLAPPVPAEPLTPAETVSPGGGGSGRTSVRSSLLRANPRPEQAAGDQVSAPQR